MNLLGSPVRFFICTSGKSPVARSIDGTTPTAVPARGLVAYGNPRSETPREFGLPRNSPVGTVRGRASCSRPERVCPATSRELGNSWRPAGLPPQRVKPIQLITRRNAYATTPSVSTLAAQMRTSHPRRQLQRAGLSTRAWVGECAISGSRARHRLCRGTRNSPRRCSRGSSG
jgi:hypothetical protein